MKHNYFVIPLRPAPYERPRPSATKKSGKIFYINPENYTKFREDCSLLAKTLYKGPVHQGPVGLYLLFEYRKPKTEKRSLDLWRPSGADIDNLTKAVSDSLEGIAYKNDKQVCEGFQRKTATNKDRIVVYVVALPKFPESLLLRETLGELTHGR